MSNVAGNLASGYGHVVAVVVAVLFTFSFLVGWKHDVYVPTDYTDEDVQKRIKAAPNVVVIQPERNMDVLVEVEVFESAPPLELAAWGALGKAPPNV